MWCYAGNESMSLKEGNVPVGLMRVEARDSDVSEGSLARLGTELSVTLQCAKESSSRCCSTSASKVQNKRGSLRT